jgi:hypothetical protein
MKKFLRILLLFASLLITRQSFALTLSDIETQIRRNVRDTATSGNRYSDAILDDWINEAQREIVNMTWCVNASTSISLVAATTYYSLPDNFITPYLVLFTETGEDTVQMKERLEGSLYDDNPSFEDTSSGSPTEYFLRQSLSGGDNLQVGFVQVPTSSSTGTVRIDYFAYPDDMSSDSDVPFGGLLHLKTYHYTLVNHVTAKIKALEGKTGEADFYRQEFERGISIMDQRLKEAPNYRPGVRAATGR